MRSTGKFFRQMSSYDGQSKVSRQDFLKWFKELSIFLPKQDMDTLLNFFDKDNDGYCNFEEFLTAIRGKPNTRRHSLIIFSITFC